MKKLLAALLVWCLLVPCFAVGETEDTFISGEWEYSLRADRRAWRQLPSGCSNCAPP